MSWTASSAAEIPTFVVSTTNRPERLSRMLQRLGRFRVKPGVFQSPRLASGILGVALGHLVVTQFALNAGYDHLLVFEDDAILSNDTFDVLASALGEVEQFAWTRLMLGGSFASPEKIQRRGKNLLWTNNPTSQTHAYVLNKSGIRWQFTELNNYVKRVARKLSKLTHAFDVALGSTHRSPCGDFQVDPIVAIQEDGYSEVSNTTFNKTADYFREQMPWAGKLGDFCSRVPTEDLQFIDAARLFS